VHDHSGRPRAEIAGGADGCSRWGYAARVLTQRFFYGYRIPVAVVALL
jgi:hypothetical protein